MPEILIYSEIGVEPGEVSSQSVMDQLAAANSAPVLVRINSVGGMVTEGVAIYNALLSYAGGVNVSIDGLAASIASLIAMAGKEIMMAENAFLMIHNAEGPGGNAAAMRRTIPTLEAMSQNILAAYVKRTGMDATAIGDLMDKESWLSAADALGMGFIDSVTPAGKITARVDFTKFRASLRSFKNAPQAFVDTVQGGMSDPNAFTAQLADLTASLKAETALREAAQGQAKYNFTALSDAKTEAATLTAKVSELTAKLGEQATKITAFEAQVAAHASALAEASKVTTEAINRKATEIIASAGHKPLNIGKDFVAGASKSMTRVEFNTLSVTGKAAAMKAGVRLAD